MQHIKEVCIFLCVILVSKKTHPNDLNLNQKLCECREREWDDEWVELQKRPLSLAHGWRWRKTSLWPFYSACFFIACFFSMHFHLFLVSGKIVCSDSSWTGDSSMECEKYSCRCHKNIHNNHNNSNIQVFYVCSSDFSSLLCMCVLQCISLRVLWHVSHFPCTDKMIRTLWLYRNFIVKTCNA